MKPLTYYCMHRCISDDFIFFSKILRIYILIIIILFGKNIPTIYTNIMRRKCKTHVCNSPIGYTHKFEYWGGGEYYKILQILV